MNDILSRLRLAKPPFIAGVIIDSDLQILSDADIAPVDMIELRIDMFEKHSVGHVIDVFTLTRKRFNKPLIATVRDVREGGRSDISDKWELYEAVMPLTELVDVEIVNAPLLLKAKQLRNGNMPLIIGSYHNFDCTPEDAMLNEIMLKGRTLGADIIKIATMAQSREDALRLLLFTHRHRSDGIITMAMGDNGIPTRVIGPLFGSIITYASVATSSAPGQISASELSGIFQSLKLR